MASRDGRNGRIEPSFGKPQEKEEDVFRVDEEERMARPERKSKQPKDREPRGSRRTSKKRGGFFGFVRRAFYWCLVLGLWGGIAFAGMLVYFAAKMPPTTDWTIPDRPPNVRIVDVQGNLIANRGTTGGEAVGLHEMSPFIPQAVMAIEDRRFRTHFGIDPIGLARAIVTNVTSGRAVQGGSTLTQQLAKNLFLSPDRTLERKVQEVMLALWLEHKYTKDQILEMYLNRVYLGSGAYGVDAASRRYFGKSAKDVNLMEAATLAGLLKAPSRLSPARDPEAASARAKLVLGAMREEGMIDDRQVAIAESEPPTRAASYWQGSENYFADRVVAEIPTLIGETKTDITVETTVDLNLQRAGEEAIKDQISANGKKLNVSQAALVSIDGTGAVRALVGGYDYAASQFDRVTDARRQPASSFKPFVYLTALEQGRTPDSVRNDAPVRIGKWTPSNDNGKYMGEVTLATALSHSLNSVSAQLVMEVGPQTVIDTAHRLGVQSKLEPNASLALGTSEVSLLELTDAYVPFANGGYRAPVYFITKITDSEGKVLYQREDGVGPRVIDERNVGMMNAMLRRTVEDGTAKRAAFGWPAAGKTGTSQNFRDAWFVGYTANLTTGVWFGNDDGKGMKRVFGSTLPVAAWKAFMKEAHKGVPVAELPGHYDIQNVVPGGSDGIDPNVPYDPSMMPQGGYGDQPIAGNGDDGYWPPAPDSPARNTLQQSGQQPAQSNGTPANYPVNDNGAPMPPGNVGGPPPQQRDSTTLLDIIMGNTQ
ncbi:transglycosylase domain-containing protein [Brucella rhizosphaerae]|uniref:Penicillin-binding, 1A family protein n=1 Tax=Brucella rhizosphaerae TaxID=571254 RepID=A0A256F4G7_9HYPH|nr:transglycosylase domain-containing protein [Brucella rhizosphaerae]OYR09742.1 penicillin-binding, 1A family protein [Brucella rhizosphaerae]